MKGAAVGMGISLDCWRSGFYSGQSLKVPLSTGRSGHSSGIPPDSTLWSAPGSGLSGSNPSPDGRRDSPGCYDPQHHGLHKQADMTILSYLHM